QAMKLKDDDEIINIEFDKPNTTILFTTKEGMSLNADKGDIPVQGRISGGVKGINMAESDGALLITQISPEDSVVLISNTAYAKRVNVNEIDVLARYRKGVKIFDLKGDSSSGTSVIASALYKASADVVIINSAGDFSNISIGSIEEDTRASRGRSLSIGQAKLSNAYIRNL
ncbi:MAG: hypothetical protein IJB98_01555, partial [Clostridia bacterium]|nr:hypothetical protein [Clostridia bacterium]